MTRLTVSSVQLLLSKLKTWAACCYLKIFWLNYVRLILSILKMGSLFMNQGVILTIGYHIPVCIYKLDYQVQKLIFLCSVRENGISGTPELAYKDRSLYF